MQDINEKQNLQIARIDERVKHIEKILENMSTNCIPTLLEKCAKMDANQKILMAFMFAITAALIGLYFT